jgi:hypothetical protein
MTSPPGGSSKPLSQRALRLLVSDMAGKIERLEQEVEQLRLDNSNLHVANQALKDEIARLRTCLPIWGPARADSGSAEDPPLAILVFQAA